MDIWKYGYGYMEIFSHTMKSEQMHTFVHNMQFINVVYSIFLNDRDSPTGDYGIALNSEQRKHKQQTISSIQQGLDTSVDD